MVERRKKSETAKKYFQPALGWFRKLVEIHNSYQINKEKLKDRRRKESVRIFKIFKGLTISNEY